MQSNKINSYVNKKLREISRNNQLRKIHDVQRKPKNKITINGKNAISFSCNDYLGLSLALNTPELFNEMTVLVQVLSEMLQGWIPK